jgi:MYXO-CTERM domain-containing protein
MGKIDTARGAFPATVFPEETIMSFRHRAPALLALAVVTAAVAAPPARAQTVPAAAKGSYVEDQQSSTTTGTSNFYTAGSTFNDFTTTFRSYFTFAIPSLGGGETFTGATLRIQAPPNAYQSADPTETYTLFNFSFTTYGSAVLSSATDNTFVEIALNASGLADINTRAGQTLAIGGAVTTLGGGGLNQQVFATSTPTSQVELVLTRTGGNVAAPEPAAGLFALLGLVAARARRRRA